MVIVVQGWNRKNPPNNRTQEQNNPNSERGIEYDGLSRIGELTKNQPKIQVVVFASSESENTKNDILTTIKSFRSINPDGQVILVGHSLGADNLVELVNENRDIEIDYMELLDIADDYDDDNIPPNVKEIINRYVIDNSLFGATMGGEKVEIEDREKTKGENIGYKNSSHRDIDQDLSDVVANEVMQKITERLNANMNKSNSSGKAENIKE